VNGPLINPVPFQTADQDEKRKAIARLSLTLCHLIALVRINFLSTYSLNAGLFKRGNQEQPPERKGRLANQSACQKAGGEISRHVIKHPTGTKADRQLEFEKREKENKCESLTFTQSNDLLSFRGKNPGTSDIEEGTSQSRRYTQTKKESRRKIVNLAR
jgi:hypothetical protein